MVPDTRDYQLSLRNFEKNVGLLSVLRVPEPFMGLIITYPETFGKS